MTYISRRHFMQVAGSTLATVGLSQLPIFRQAERYGKVLAQSTPRKLALLVGINSYPDGKHSRALKGCLTDLELNRNLLIYKFGFKPQDIYTLSDKKATRQGILEAFEEHLINQAKPGDVVVFHYSGHGSRVFDPDVLKYGREQGTTGFTGSFVPVDSRLPTGYPNTGGVVQDILGHTLFLLMSAVQTEYFTAVLDSCYSGGATRTFNYIVRSRDGGANLKVADSEKAFQEKWLSRLNLSEAEYVRRYREGVAKGVVLAATDTYQTAADARFNDFHAGAFTYYLTQYLWQATSTVSDAIANVNANIPKRFKQTPKADVKVGSGYLSQPIYFIDAQQAPAQAVITEVNGGQVKLWLGGLGQKNLARVYNGTVFSIVDTSGRSFGTVTLQSHDGLIGEGTLAGTAESGTLLQLASDSSPPRN